MSRAVAYGKACQRHATMPATKGAENDVPTSRIIVPRPVITAAGLPRAMTSGFMRPSAVGPILLKAALRKSGVTAPTVIISSASAGTLSASDSYKLYGISVNISSTFFYRTSRGQSGSGPIVFFYRIF